MSKQTIISVSELNRHAKQLLQTELGMLWVRGEISSFSRPASGHWYFTLKDNHAQIRCAMFKGRNRLLRLTPQQGDEVIVRGVVGLYEVRGDYQLIAEHIEAEGEGRLRQAFEQLKRDLANEGLFAQEHKRALPLYPRHIAIISSATGAAVRDICSVFKRRWPSVDLTIVPCLVQGTSASAELVRALERVQQWQTQTKPAVDAIIIGRGGGSLEDLQAFNEEALARAIFACQLPVVSAVGHEIDYSISDFVADARAATPSAAAEILCPHQDDVRQSIDHHQQRLVKGMQHALTQANHALRRKRSALRHPSEQLNHYQHAFRLNLKQLRRALLVYSNQQQRELHSLGQRLSALQPTTQRQREQLERAATELHKVMQQYLEHKGVLVHQQMGLLNSVSPLATLERGYAIVRDKQQRVVRSVVNVKHQQSLHITLAEGALTARVDTIEVTSNNSDNRSK